MNKMRAGITSTMVCVCVVAIVVSVIFLLARMVWSQESRAVFSNRPIDSLVVYDAAWQTTDGHLFATRDEAMAWMQDLYVTESIKEMLPIDEDMDISDAWAMYKLRQFIAKHWREIYSLLSRAQALPQTYCTLPPPRMEPATQALP